MKSSVDSIRQQKKISKLVMSGCWIKGKK